MTYRDSGFLLIRGLDDLSGEPDGNVFKLQRRDRDGEVGLHLAYEPMPPPPSPPAQDWCMGRALTLVDRTRSTPSREVCCDPPLPFAPSRIFALPWTEELPTRYWT